MDCGRRSLTHRNWHCSTRPLPRAPSLTKKNQPQPSVNTAEVVAAGGNFLHISSGGRAAAVLYSIMASAKAREAEPLLYVRDLLETFAREDSPNLDQLLPGAWLRTHPEARRQWPR